MNLVEIDGTEIETGKRKELLSQFCKTLPRDQLFLARDLLAQGLDYQTYGHMWEGVKKSDCRKIENDWRDFLSEQLGVNNALEI